MNDTNAQLIADFAAQVKETSRRFAAEQLAPGRRDALAGLRIAERLAAIFDLAGGRMIELTPTEQPLACKAGCASCCSLLLLVEAPFVLWMADSLRACLDPATLAAIARAFAAESGACPLLVHGQCQAYATRPLVCRAHTSIDADRCARHAAGEDVAIEGHGGQAQVWHGMAAGLAEALNESGLGRDVALHFRRAMAVALNLPDASARWAAGEDIFAAARSPAFDQAFRMVHGDDRFGQLSD